MSTINLELSTLAESRWLGAVSRASRYLVHYWNPHHVGAHQAPLTVYQYTKTPTTNPLPSWLGWRAGKKVKQGSSTPTRSTIWLLEVWRGSECPPSCWRSQQVGICTLEYYSSKFTTLNRNHSLQCRPPSIISAAAATKFSRRALNNFCCHRYFVTSTLLLMSQMCR